MIYTKCKTSSIKLIKTPQNVMLINYIINLAHTQSKQQIFPGTQTLQKLK